MISITHTYDMLGVSDRKGSPLVYRFTDFQGNVTMVTDGKDALEQHNGYYPYGEPWRELSGQPYLYGAKERMRDNGLNEYDFSARRLHSALCLWTTPDPLAQKFANTNPLAYCAANPIKFIDPNGCANFYTYLKDEIVYVGSDGENDGRFFLVNKSLGKKISKLTKKGKFYQGEIENNKKMVEITNITEVEQIQQLVIDGNSDGYERGMYKDENGVAFVSDKGGEVVSTDEKGSSHSVNPFIVNGHHPKTNPYHSLYYMHVHSINSAHKDFGKSNPTNTDKKTDKDMRDLGYTGTTFLVGGKDRKINFYYKNKSVLKVGLDQFINFIKKIRK